MLFGGLRRDSKADTGRHGRTQTKGDTDGVALEVVGQTVCVTADVCVMCLVEPVVLSCVVECGVVVRWLRGVVD